MDTIMIKEKVVEIMAEKPPMWKNGILYVWSKYHKSYIANYCPSHYWQLGIGLKKYWGNDHDGFN